MRVVDTSAWIEYLGNSKFGKKFAAEFPAHTEWLVPTIVQLELGKWLAREGNGQQANQVIGFSKTCVVADMDTDVALAAAELSVRHKLATADAIVYATALIYGADLITCDKHFENLPDVRFMSKQS